MQCNRTSMHSYIWSFLLVCVEDNVRVSAKKLSILSFRPSSHLRAKKGGGWIQDSEHTHTHSCKRKTKYIISCNTHIELDNSPYLQPDLPTSSDPRFLCLRCSFFHLQTHETRPYSRLWKDKKIKEKKSHVFFQIWAEEGQVAVLPVIIFSFY